MKLEQLFLSESQYQENMMLEQQESSDRVVFTFMRANPPTRGHHLVVDQVARQAHGDDYWIFLSQSQDPKKNPLDRQTKMHFAKVLMPNHKAHFASGVPFAAVKTPLLAADWLYNQGYRDITMVVGSDRVATMKDILDGWNSPEIRTKYSREPCKIAVVSAGDRDPDAEGVEGISASMVRQLAQAGDFDAFRDAVGMDAASALAMYDAVRKGMKVTAAKDKKKVQEGLWNKLFGKSKTRLVRPPHFPPHPHNVEDTAQWVKDWVAYEKSEGNNPEKLFDPNTMMGDIWLSIHAASSREAADKVRQFLLSDPELGHMIRSAPERRSRGHGPSASGSDHYSTSDRTQGPRHDDHMGPLDPLWEDANHKDGTIVKLEMDPESARKLASWCAVNQIHCMDPDHFHITLVYSRRAMPELSNLDGTNIHLALKAKAWKKLGESALVLVFESPQLQALHSKIIKLGATHDWPDLIIHTTVNYDYTDDQLPAALPTFPLVYNRVTVDAIDPNYKADK